MRYLTENENLQKKTVSWRWFDGLQEKSRNYEGSIRACIEDSIYDAIVPYGGKMPLGLTIPGLGPVPEEYWSVRED